MESGEKMSPRVLSSCKVEFNAIELMLVSVDHRNPHSGLLLLRSTSKEERRSTGTIMEGIRLIQVVGNI